MFKKIVFTIFTIILLVGLLLPFIQFSENNEKTLDVVIIAGQSNAMNSNNIAQCNPYIINEDIPIIEGVYYYGTQYSVINPIGYYAMDYDETLNSYSFNSMVKNNQWIIGGGEPSLAYTIKQKTSADVYVINVGIAGATIQFLQPDNIGGEYTKKIINDAINKIPNSYSKINYIGWVWIQGESNSHTPVNEYIEYFNNISAMYNELNFNTCYMVQTSPLIGGNSSIAQLDICNTDPNVTLASEAPGTFTVENGLLNSDNIHYTQKGRIIIGKEVGEIIEPPQINKKQTVISGLLSIVPIIILISTIFMIIKK